MCRFALQMLTFSVESSQFLFCFVFYIDCYKDSYLYALFIVTFSALIFFFYYMYTIVVYPI